MDDYIFKKFSKLINHLSVQLNKYDSYEGFKAALNEESDLFCLSSLLDEVETSFTKWCREECLDFPNNLWEDLEMDGKSFLKEIDNKTPIWWECLRESLVDAVSHALHCNLKDSTTVGETP